MFLQQLSNKFSLPTGHFFRCVQVRHNDRSSCEAFPVHFIKPLPLVRGAVSTIYSDIFSLSEWSNVIKWSWGC